MHNLVKIRLFRILLWISYPISLVLVWPLVILKKKSSSHLFFFFDRYVIGGAQRIHIDILESISEIWKQVYFTRKSENDYFKKEFYSIPNSKSHDIHFWCDNLLFRLFSVHYYAFYINRHVKAHVFSSNSTFFYDMLPFLKLEVTKTELLHNFTFGKKGMEFFGLANSKLLDYRVVYDSFTLSNIQMQYKQYNLEALLSRLLFIEPGVEIADKYYKKSELPLKILYAGRGGPQKRIPLINKICEECMIEGLPVSFHFAGTMTEELSEQVKRNSTIHGQVTNLKDMYKIYRSCHVLLMTSAYEGFPMFIKEGMANGCVPVVTALEGNKMHLTSGSNSLLIEAVDDEDKVVFFGLENIRKLVQDFELLEMLSNSAYYYACKHFSKNKFIEQYRKLLLNGK